MIHPKIYPPIHIEDPSANPRSWGPLADSLRSALRSLGNSALELLQATAETLRWSGSNLKPQPVPVRTRNRIK